MHSAAIRSTADPLAQGRVGDHRLMRRHRAGDPRARELMIERYLPLAIGLALRYRRGAEPAEDLIQVASIGLVKAVDRWDPDRGLAFSTFAVPTILGELRRYFRDLTWDVRPPRRLQDLAAALERAREAMHGETGREPTVAELAGRVRRDRTEVEEALIAGEGRKLRSLDSATHDSGGEEIGATVADVVGGRDVGFERAEARATIARLDWVLDDRERAVLRLHFEQDLTQAEIGQRVGCSQMQVSRIIRGAVDKLALHARLRSRPPELAAAA